MKKCLPALICAAFLSLMCQSFAEVGQKASFPSFADGHIYGEKISADDLRGKVVFFEYWGVNCPPCRAAMPHLIDLQKKYRSQGFVVIGSHCQGLGPAVNKYLEENKVNFPSYAFKSIPEAPCPGMLPYSVLIGADGRIVGQGQPGQIYGLVEGAVEKASKGYPILDGVELDKYKALEKSIISTGTNVEGKVEELRSAAEEGDAEAKAICDAYDAWLELEKKRVERQCESNPLLAVKSISSLKKAVPSVTEFDEKLEGFSSNPVYQKLASIQKKVEGLQKRDVKGKHASSGALKGIRKSLAELSSSQEAGVESICEGLKASVDELEKSAATAKREKSEKRAERKQKHKVYGGSAR